MTDIIDERRMASIINDAAAYRHIRQIILNNDRTELPPILAKPESKATRRGELLVISIMAPLAPFI
jgi:hypothetical protein